MSEYNDEFLELLADEVLIQVRTKGCLKARKIMISPKPYIVIPLPNHNIFIDFFDPIDGMMVSTTISDRLRFDSTSPDALAAQKECKSDTIFYEDPLMFDKINEFIELIRREAK